MKHINQRQPGHIGMVQLSENKSLNDTWTNMKVCIRNALEEKKGRRSKKQYQMRDSTLEIVKGNSNLENSQDTSYTLKLAKLNREIYIEVDKS